MNPKFLIILSLLMGLSSSALAQTTNNALHFDGTDDYVQLDTFPAVDFSNGFSYTAWVRWNSYKNWTRLIDLSNGPTSDEIIIANFEGTDTLGLWVIDGGTNKYLYLPDAVIKNQWIHIAVTIDASGYAKFYKDGIQMIAGNVSVPSSVLRTDCFIGRSMFNDDSHFGGCMDEVSIWNKELTHEEIGTLKDNGLAGNEAGLVAYYDFNQGSEGNNAKAKTLISEVNTPAVNGTLTNFALTSYNTSNWIRSDRVPKWNNSLHFDGVDDYIELSKLPLSVNFNLGFSYAAWIKWDVLNDTTYLFDLSNGNEKDNLSLVYNNKDSTLTFCIYSGINGSSLRYKIIPQTGVWTHIAVSVDGSGLAKIFINGFEKCSGTVFAPVSLERNLFTLGRNPKTGSTNFCGSMDEVGIWYYAQTEYSIGITMNSTYWMLRNYLLFWYDFNRGFHGNDNHEINTLFTKLCETDVTGILRGFDLNGTVSNWDKGYVLSVSPKPGVTLSKSSGDNERIIINTNSSWSLHEDCDWLELNVTSLEVETKRNENTGYAVWATANSPNNSNESRHALIILQSPESANDTLVAMQVGFPGNGTEDDPFQIATFQDLCTLSEFSFDQDKYYTQVADIDASETRNMNSGKGFMPIGTYHSNPFDNSFRGYYNGKGHKISNLFINRADKDNIGLFGYVWGARIDSLLVTNAEITGHQYVGGLMAYGRNDTINNCSFTGRISGTSQIGGLAGIYFYSVIENSFVSAGISGSGRDIGGLVGSTSRVKMNSCYASGTASGECFVGGLVGLGFSSMISNCYGTNNIRAQGLTGGIIGGSYDGNTISSCYTAAYVQGNEYTGSIAGSFRENSVMNNCLWNKLISQNDTCCGQLLSATVNNCSGLNTESMKKQASLAMLGSFDMIWAIREDSTYAALRSVDNAPFAFSDSLKGHHIAGSALLDNDFDYETLQQSLVYKIDSLLMGTSYNGYIDFPNESVIGDTMTVYYRAGELRAVGDTLWGNQAVSSIAYYNHAPLLSQVPAKTTPENTALEINLQDIAASDADMDPLLLIIYGGEHHSVNETGIMPESGFTGSLVVDIAVSDGRDTSNVMPMNVTVTEVTSTEKTYSDQLRIYPNPAKDELYIENAAGKQVEIMNVSGKIVFKGMIRNNHESIGISQFPAGLYSIKVGNAIMKIVIN